MSVKPNRAAVAAIAGVLGFGGTVLVALPVVAGERGYDGRRAVYVIDGDTPKVDPAINDTRPVRLLNVDAPELGGQEPWATESREHLVSLLSAQETFAVRTDATFMDQYDRVLGHVFLGADAVNVNRELLRTGHAVLHVLWPNVAHFEGYRQAQKEARRNGRGVWDPANPLKMLPYAYRLRKQREVPEKLAGDWFTRKYVAAEDYGEVHVNNRVFFWNERDAERAGFAPCARDRRGTYDETCFHIG